MTTVQKSLIDGVIRGLLIYILGEFLISAYVELSPLLTGAILALCILIPVVVLALFVGKETFNASIGVCRWIFYDTSDGRCMYRHMYSSRDCLCVLYNQKFNWQKVTQYCAGSENNCCTGLEQSLVLF